MHLCWLGRRGLAEVWRMDQVRDTWILEITFNNLEALINTKMGGAAHCDSLTIGTWKCYCLSQPLTFESL